jgi:hypothetical protein
VSHMSLPRTTHTVEMSQLAELVRRLSDLRSRITAAELGLAGAKTLAGQPDDELPASAVLVRLCWDGPPEFPYIHAHFGIGDHGASRIVDLHTAALRALGRRLGVRQQWGS